MASPWRKESRRIIAHAVVEGERMGLAGVALERFVTAKYPFGPRTNYPYKCWCDEMKLQVRGRKLERAPTRPVDADGQGSLFATGIDSGAILSTDELYRYELWRLWEPDLPACNFIMLNPSTADATLDDATIRRCVDYARRWGYGGLIVTNLFSLRSTDPTALKSHPDPIGPENDRHIVEVATRAGVVVAAWGGHGKLQGRAGDVRLLLECSDIIPSMLRLTASGEPGHPLYLPAGLRPVPWAERPAVVP